MARLTAARFWSGLLTDALTGKRRRRWKAAANGNRFPRGRKGRSRRRFRCRRPSSRRRACRGCGGISQRNRRLALTPALDEPKENIERPTSNFERRREREFAQPFDVRSWMFLRVHGDLPIPKNRDGIGAMNPGVAASR